MQQSAKEFLVTIDGRLFYWRSLMKKIELIDAEEPEPEQKSSTGSMTTEEKIKVLSGMPDEELLKCFGHYAGKNILECSSTALVSLESLPAFLSVLHFPGVSSGSAR